jgi:hypothetical protein
VTNLAAIYQYPKTEASMRIFMNWVGHKIPTEQRPQGA